MTLLLPGEWTVNGILMFKLCALHSGQVLPDSAALEMSNKMALCSNHISFVLHSKIFVFNLLKLMNKTKVFSQLHFPFKIDL